MNNIDSAVNYFNNKFHCSQAVFAAFAPELGLPEEQALKIGAGFGSGMCKGEVCGAVTGALMALGLKYGHSDSADIERKVNTSRLTVLLLERFKQENGSYLCKDLLGLDLSVKEDIEKAKASGVFTSFCPKMVESAARILDEIFKEEK